MNLTVQVVDADGSVVWAHGRDASGHRSGVTSRDYPNDGTLKAVRSALAQATDQASAEALGADDPNRVTDRC